MCGADVKYIIGPHVRPQHQKYLSSHVDYIHEREDFYESRNVVYSV